MKRLAIIGAGEFGLQIYNLVTQFSLYEVVGFFDDEKPADSFIIKNCKVIGKIDKAVSFYYQKNFDEIIIAIGYRDIQAREQIYTKLSKEIPFATIIHPSCIIDKTAKIGSGVVMYAGCIVDKNVCIEDNVLLNLRVTVSHDTRIGKNSYISPCSVFSGFVSLGKNNFVGTGAVFKNDINICDNNIFGIGAIITKDISEKGIYIGNPANIKQKQ